MGELYSRELGDENFVSEKSVVEQGSEVTSVIE